MIIDSHLHFYDACLKNTPVLLELFTEVIPCAERVYFLKTGGEA